jgi:hypothetical protein
MWASTESPRLWVLAALMISAGVDGMTHFLYSSGIGTYFSKLQAWAKEIDAPVTLAYAKSATAQLKRLHGGKLPPMSDAPRLVTVRDLEVQDEASGGAGLFEVQDAEYRDAVVEELPRRLRAYLSAHQTRIEREILENAGKYQAS